VAAGDGDQLDGGIAHQAFTDLQGGDGRPPRNVVPALLEGVGNAHGLGHHPMMAAPA
jgi:hypothetical protein